MFNWEDFIKFSDELLAKKLSKYEEALYRTVISRAYYGVFKQVEDFFENNKLKKLLDKSKGYHERIINFLKNHYDHEISTFGGGLDRLRKDRLKADYNADKNVTEELAKRTVILADELSSKWWCIKSKLKKHNT